MIIININCINKCKYQIEGKCNLLEIPLTKSFYISGKKTDCPYSSGRQSYKDFKIE